MPSEEQRLRTLARARKHGDKALEVFTLEAMAREGYPEVVEADILHPKHDEAATKYLEGGPPKPILEAQYPTLKEKPVRRAPVKPQTPSRAKRIPKRTPRKRGR